MNLVMKSFLIAALLSWGCRACAEEGPLVESPVVKVIEESDYTINLRYFDDENVEIYTRVYKEPTDSGKIIINAIHIPKGMPRDRALMQENIFQDNYVFRFYFNRSVDYHHHIDKYPNGKEAILVYRTKDRKLVAVIGKKESGEWDTEYDKELTTLIRKYHPELER